MSRVNAGDPDPSEPEGLERLPRGITQAILAFHSANAEWVARFPITDPIYPIPPDALGPLTRPRSIGRIAPLFNGIEADAERNYSRLCDTHRIAGIWGTEPVWCGLFQADRPVLDPEVVQELGWTDAQIDDLPRLHDRADDTRERLTGVAGWLLTDPAFRGELSDLRHQWEDLPADRRRRFPLGRADPFDTARRAGRPKRAATEFAGRLTWFLDRWGLTRFATWDLPEPQGPLVPNDLPRGAPAQPAHGIHVFIPLHYPLRGDDAIQQRVEEFQRRRVQGLGIDPSFGGVSHHRAYAQMFRLMHHERTVRSRFPDGPPAGIVGHIEFAADAHLGLALEQVRKLRKGIAACLRGGRGGVRWLN